MDTKLDEAECVQTTLDQLNLIEDNRLGVVCHGQLYQKRMKRVFDKKICPWKFYSGDLVATKIIVHSHSDPKGKCTPNYEAPYIVKKSFLGGALILTDMDGEDVPLSVNSDLVKKILCIKDPLSRKPTRET